jgi:hypothetical protein
MFRTTRFALLVLLGAPYMVASFTSTSTTSRSISSVPISNDASSATTTTITTTQLHQSSTSQEIDWPTQLVEEAKEIGSCASILFLALFKPDKNVGAEDIVKICDSLDEVNTNMDSSDLFVSRELSLRRRAIEIQRYEWLAKLLKTDYDAYVATASFLSPSRIPRLQLPNVQDVPMTREASNMPETLPADTDSGVPLVVDCELDDMVYNDSPLDKALLAIFRKLVTQNTGGVTSETDGILGLLEQGRAYLLQPGQTAEAQHKMVRDTLGGLMTPVLPPFYRIFMTGIVPKLGTDLDGKQFGPWFYAPFLTSFVTPTFFGFLVGPSYPNRRKDGELGGLVVEKCKFLQESGCKGLCLHQCKLPAQQFFQDELGLALTVRPNFVTQECQWSFGETPLPPDEDPSFPKGCLVGCESRKAIAATGSKADICN